MLRVFPGDCLMNATSMFLPICRHKRMLCKTLPFVAFSTSSDLSSFLTQDRTQRPSPHLVCLDMTYCSLGTGKVERAKLDVVNLPHHVIFANCCRCGSQLLRFAAFAEGNQSDKSCDWLPLQFHSHALLIECFTCALLNTSEHLGNKPASLVIHFRNYGMTLLQHHSRTFYTKGHGALNLDTTCLVRACFFCLLMWESHQFPQEMSQK